MSSDYDIEISLDDTLELDTIIENWNGSSSVLNLNGDEDQFDISGIQTKTSILNPLKSGDYTITINGQELSVKVTDPNKNPKTKIWDDKTNWTAIGDGVTLSTNRSTSGSQSAVNGNDYGNESTTHSVSGRDGSYSTMTESDSPKEPTIESKRWIDDRGNNDNSAGYYLRYQDTNNYYCAGLGINMSQFWVVKKVNGSYSTSGTTNISTIPTKEWIDHKIETEIVNSNLVFTLKINGSVYGSVTDSNPSFENGGAVGIGMSGSDGNKANNNTAYIMCYTDETKITY